MLRFQTSAAVARRDMKWQIGAVAPHITSHVQRDFATLYQNDCPHRSRRVPAGPHQALR